MQVNFSKLRRSLVIFFVVCLSTIILTSLVVYVSAQGTPPPNCPPMNSVPCENTGVDKDTSGVTWPKGAKVIVNIDPSFSPEKIAAIKSSYNNWQTAGSALGNGSGVTFTFTTLANPSTASLPAGTYRAQVNNFSNPRPDLVGKASSNGVDVLNGEVVGQEIWVNRSVTDECAVAQTVAHETGHGFGLGDCSNCSRSSLINSTSAES